MLQLKSCPKSPNCVCTQDSIKRKQAEPLSYSDSSEKAISQLKNLIREYENATLVNEKQNYMHYEFVTKLGKFTDDVEFLLDPENKMIHFRSASRTGYGDFGKNKRRMRKIQKAWSLSN